MDNRVSLQKLEVFCLVVELGSVSRAADELYVSAPVVSEHLRTFQSRVGATLLHRDGRRMVTTEAGGLTYAWAREVLSRSTELSRDIEGLASGTRGSVVIGASIAIGTYVLPPILARLHKQQPLTTVRIFPADQAGTLKALAMGEFDFALVLAAPNDDFSPHEAQWLYDEPFVLVAAAENPEPDTITPQRLSEIPMVCSPRGEGRRRRLDMHLRRLGVDDRNVVMELGHPEAIKQAVRAQVGVAMLPGCSVADDLNAGTLRQITIGGAQSSIPLFMVKRRNKHMGPLQEQIIAAITEDARQRREGHQGMAAVVG